MVGNCSETPRPGPPESPTPQGERVSEPVGNCPEIPPCFCELEGESHPSRFYLGPEGGGAGMGGRLFSLSVPGAGDPQGSPGPLFFNRKNPMRGR